MILFNMTFAPVDEQPKARVAGCLPEGRGLTPLLAAFERAGHQVVELEVFSDYEEDIEFWAEIHELALNDAQWIAWINESWVRFDLALAIVEGHNNGAGRLPGNRYRATFSRLHDNSPPAHGAIA